MPGKIYIDRAVIGAVQVFDLSSIGVENPNNVVSANSGDLAVDPENGITWQCQGEAAWSPINGQASVALTEAPQQRGQIAAGDLSFVGDGICNGATAVEDVAARGVGSGGAYIEQDTTAVPDNSAYIHTPIMDVVSSCRPIVAIDFALPDLADVRFVAGICNAGFPAVFDSDDPAAAQGLVQFSPGRGDVNFMFALRGSGAQVLADTGILAIANRRYTFIIDAPENIGAEYRQQYTLIDRQSGTQFVLTNTVGNNGIGTIPCTPFSGIRTNVADVTQIRQYGIRLTLRGPTE